MRVLLMNSDPSSQLDISQPPLEPFALIVAGREDLGLFFSAFLEKFLGWRSNVVGAYGDLKDVLSVLSQDRYDLLLVTNNSLVPDHIQEVVSGVRSAYPSLPILVVSGFTEPEFIVDLVQRGADEVIPMPFDPGQLIASVKWHCHIE
jgi:DNA-binding response OmpR family regulator